MIISTLIGAFLVVVIVTTVIILTTRTEYLWGYQAKLLIFLVLAEILLLLSIPYFQLPETNFGKQQSVELVEQFMSALSTGDYDKVESLFTYGLIEEYPDARAILQDPETVPISWVIAAPNSRGYALGEATLANAMTLPVAISVEWEWEKGQWGVTMLDVDDTSLRFILYDFNLPYQTVRNILNFFATTCLILSSLLIQAVVEKRNLNQSFPL